MPTDIEKVFQTAVDELSNSTDTDIYLFSNGIYDQQVDRLIEEIRNLKRRRKNASLILCTNGGSADSGYRLARCIRRAYSKFAIYVFGNCKSTGTLVAVAASEIVMSDFGQFGPLDVQLADKNEFYGQTPALDVQQSLMTLSRSALDCFMHHFLQLEPGRAISTKTACEIAEALTLGIVEPIAAQIDPLLLGRVDRSMRIAEAYIKRLNPAFQDAEIKKLIGQYPSHEFVIDFDEAKEIFQNVRKPTDAELEIEDILRKFGKVPDQDNWIGLISTKLHEEEVANVASNNHDGKNGQSDAEHSVPSVASSKQRTR